MSFWGVTTQGQPNPPMLNPEIAAILTNVPPPGFKTRFDYVRSFKSVKEVDDARHAGVLNDDEAVLAYEALEDTDSMDIYGKVIDQSGNPIARVQVNGNLHRNVEGSIPQKTVTDAQGRFQFLGLHGAGFNIELQKEGYYFDYMLPCAHRPKNYLPDPDKPLIITMWKRRGAEPMKHIYIQSSVPCDGTPEHFNLLASKMNGTIADIRPSSGDFTVTLTRNPLVVQRPHPFNWSVTLSITNGGLLEYTNQPYPYEAPEAGYHSVVTMDFPTNMPHWQNEIKQGYYFKSNDGQIYGRMTICIVADRPQPPTYFTAEVYANPAGSRNLEFDPQKQTH